METTSGQVVQLTAARRQQPAPPPPSAQLDQAAPNPADQFGALSAAMITALEVQAELTRAAMRLVADVAALRVRVDAQAALIQILAEQVREAKPDASP